MKLAFCTLMSSSGMALHAEPARSAAPGRDFALRAASRTATTEPSRRDPEWPPALFDFKCTGCGKCCAAPGGDVWMSASEVTAAATALGLARAAFVAQFVESQRAGWCTIRLRDGRAGEGLLGAKPCALLGPDGKTCTIYSARPKQCSTFPFWPGVIDSRKSWDEEALRPWPFWTPLVGGCEGINAAAPEEERVPLAKARSIAADFARYTAQFPGPD